MAVLLDQWPRLRPQLLQRLGHDRRAIPQSSADFGTVRPDLFVVTNGVNSRTFNALPGGGYAATFFVQEQLAFNANGAEYVLTDTHGDVMRFNDFDAHQPATWQGQFKSFTDPDGNVT